MSQLAQSVAPILSPTRHPNPLTPMRRFRVVLADHHHLLLSALDRFLSNSPELEVVAITTSSRKALALVDLHQPDLLLISLTMPDIPGTSIARQFAGKPSAPKVIIMALDDDSFYRSAAQSAGASGFLAKSDLGERILPMIRSLF